MVEKLLRKKKLFLKFMNTQPNMLYDTYKYYELYDVIGEEK